MSTSSTPVSGSLQAGGSPSGDGSTSNNDGQGTFSMPVVPEGSATAKQSKAKSPGAGQPAQDGDKTVFDGGSSGENGEGTAGDGEGSPPSKDQNKDNKSQRKGQEGWQGLVEGIAKLTERIDKMEASKPVEKAGDGDDNKKSDDKKQENEALTKALEAINSTNSRLERMEFENENPDLKTAELSSEWKKVNSDPKFKDFSMQERADYVRGRTGKSAGNAIKDQLSRAEGSMPRGSGSSGKPAYGGNPNVTEEDVAVGRAFGISREELERELS